VVNILCIWVAESFTCWFKEVVPIKRKDAFFTNDIQTYRGEKKTVNKMNRDSLIFAKNVPPLQLKETICALYRTQRNSRIYLCTSSTWKMVWHARRVSREGGSVGVLTIAVFETGGGTVSKTFLMHKRTV